MGERHLAESTICVLGPTNEPKRFISLMILRVLLGRWALRAKAPSELSGFKRRLDFVISCIEISTGEH